LADEVAKINKRVEDNFLGGSMSPYENLTMHEDFMIDEDTFGNKSNNDPTEIPPILSTEAIR